METEAGEKAASPLGAPSQQQNLQQHQQQDNEPRWHHQQQLHTDKPSPASAEVKEPPSPAVVAAAAAAGHQPTANGVATPLLQQSTSPRTRSGTPQSHPSTPKVNVVNGHGPLPAPPNVDASLSAEATAAVNAVASANNAARAKDHLRWRDPITVKYDVVGQPQPGKLQAQQSPAQSVLQLPPPPPPPPQYPYQAPPIQQQHPPEPLPSLHLQSRLPHSQPQHSQQQQAPAPLPQHRQQQQPQHPLHTHHTSAPPPAPRQPLPAYSSQATLQPVPPQPGSLPPLHHPPPPAASHPLPSVTRLAAHAPQPISKPIIMDPPARRVSQPSSPRQVSFASPTVDHAQLNPKFVDDCTRMTFAVQQSLPEAVRRIIRDNWEKCLLGSEFHQAFILNASIHHANTSITRRAVRDFGLKMVQDSREEIMEHFTTKDLDLIVDQILAKASDSFLDKCLEKRLLTMEAKTLINALAKAERLGYDPSDIVQEDRHERVIAREAYPGAGSPATPVYAQQQQSRSAPPPPPAYPAANQQMQCMKCFRTFTHPNPFEYHTRFNVCSLAPPTADGFKYACGPCGQQFATAEEHQMHGDNRACVNYSSTKSSRGPGRPPRTAPISQPNPVAILPSMTQSPGTNGYSPAQGQAHATPTQTQPASRRNGAAAAAVAATPTGSPNPSDPYGHLSKSELDAMNEELQAAEAKYAPRFKEAEQIPDENERRGKIEGLRNSFGTKQSMIRKKYGVRLRERRTKAEIQAEKERLGIKRAEREKARAAMNAAPPASGPAVHAESTPGRLTGHGWTAANTPRPDNVWEEHDAKRRRLGGTGEYKAAHQLVADETPTRKTLSVAEMGGGLSGSPATAATHDPTLPPSTQVQSKPPAQPDNPQSTHPSPASSSTPNSESRRATARLPSEKQHNPRDDSGSSDDDDIPSTLPSHTKPAMTPQKAAASAVAL